MKIKILHTFRNKERRQNLFILLFLSIVSISALLYYFKPGMTLSYADTISRLDIARKVVDNLNPGYAQFGSVWLPLPQALMLPFIWNDYLWHSGLAGSFMSMMAFIVGGFYLYKSAYFISKSFLPSFFTLCVFALNINLYFLQSTAMSESLFLCFLSICIYYLLVWVNTNNRRYLILAGAGLSGLTLIRYEGLALLLSSIVVVVICSIFANRKWKRVEGDVILFVAIACFGFALWTIYLAATFGDPLFWLRYYGFEPSFLAKKAVLTVAAKAASAAIAATPPPQSKPFLAGVWEYFSSVTWMTGVIPMILAGAGLVVGIAQSLFKKKFGTILVLLLPFSIFLLMTLTLMRNTPLIQPSLNMQNIKSLGTSLYTGFNIRYGIMLLPWLALLSIYVYNIKRPFYIPSILLFGFFSIQIYNYFVPHFSPIYIIPYLIYAKPDGQLVTWMKKNYDGGYIMISASGFEDQMFAMGFPYRTYIHEGAGKYWTEALDRPARYANWIIIDFNRESDWLGRELKHKQYWSYQYKLVYEQPSSSVKVYKIITKPDIIIPK